MINFGSWKYKKFRLFLLLQALLVADFGPRLTIRIVESLREDILAGKLKSGSEIKVGWKRRPCYSSACLDLMI